MVGDSSGTILGKCRVVGLLDEQSAFAQVIWQGLVKPPVVTVFDRSKILRLPIWIDAVLGFSTDSEGGESGDKLSHGCSGLF